MKLPFDTKLGILVTDQMDAEIDRLLPFVQSAYQEVRKHKKSMGVGEFNFVDPYTGQDRYSPLLIECREDESLAWTRFHVVAINAIRELKDHQYRRMVAHELIHVIDPECHSAVYHSPKDDWGKYMMQDREFNAYSGMIAYSIRKNAKTWRNTEHHNSWVKGIAESYDFIKDPTGSIEQYRSAGVFDGDYISILLDYQELLSMERYELFIGRVRFALDDGMAHLQGKTVTPLLVA